MVEYEECDSLSLFRVVAELLTYKIIRSTMYSAKTVFQISAENEIPLSSTYKKIKALCKSGILSIERVSIDDGKKVFYYRCRIRAIEASLNEKGLAVHVKR